MTTKKKIRYGIKVNPIGLTFFLSKYIIFFNNPNNNITTENPFRDPVAVGIFIFGKYQKNFI